MAWEWVNALLYEGSRRGSVFTHQLQNCIALELLAETATAERIRARAKLSVWTVQTSCRAIWHRLTHTGRVAATKTHGGFHPLTKHTHIYTHNKPNINIHQTLPNTHWSCANISTHTHNLSQIANSKNPFLPNTQAKFIYFNTHRFQAKRRIYSYT